MKRTFFVILTIMLGLSACTLIVDCIEGNGIMKSEERTASSFTAIANETSFQVVYLKGSTHSITIEAESNILPYITTDIRGGALEVSTVRGSHCLRYRTKPVITVTAPFISELVNAGSGDILAGDLEGENVKLVVSGSGDILAGAVSADDASAVISGSGNIITDGISVSSFRATLSGSGDLTVKGETLSSRHVVSGSGTVFAGDLQTKTAVVTMSGSGSVYTNVADRLDAVISGSGNIYLHGNPQLSVTRTGSGRIIHL